MFGRFPGAPASVNKRKYGDDRFIQYSIDLPLAQSRLQSTAEALLPETESEHDTTTSTSGAYQDMLSHAVFNRGSEEVRTCSIFSSRLETDQSMFGSNSTREIRTKIARTSPVSIKAQDRIDAFAMLDDFYTQPIAISEDELMYACMGPRLYCWSGMLDDIRLLDSETVDENQQSPLTYSAVCSGPSFDGCFAGTTTGKARLFDVEENLMVSEYNLDRSKICSIAAQSQFIYTLGAYNGYIYFIDLRLNTFSPAQTVANVSRAGAVCGLVYSHNNNYLASGGNDNAVKIWDYRRLDVPTFVYTGHVGAVKAITFSHYHPARIATGGGNADCSVRIWNCVTGEQHDVLNVKPVDSAFSHVTSVSWSSQNEIVLTAGRESQVWQRNCSDNKYRQVLSEEMHAGRIISAIPVPSDHNRFASIGSDQAIRFWKVHSNRDNQTPSLARRTESAFSSWRLR